MNETVFHLRAMNDRDWATVIFVVAFALIAITKTFFENRFADFIKLFVSDKYIKIYKDSSHLWSGFTIALFFVQLISLAFFIQLVLHYFGYASKTDWVVFVQLFTFLGVFILSKYLLEKIIATSFNLEEFVEQFNLQKLSYRTYAGLLILPINIVLFYNNNPSRGLLYGLIGAILTINMLTYAVSLKNYQNLLFGKLFYFILYLCALEIAPYYFIYYCFTKKLAH